MSEKQTWGERGTAIAREMLAPLGITTDEEIWGVLMEYTGWPCFFTGTTEDDSAAQLREQLQEFVDNAGERLKTEKEGTQ